MKIWGTGEPKREFLHVDDMAKGCIKMMNLDSQIFYRDEDLYSHVNLGTGKDIEIRELANIISKVVGFKGQISFDISKPDGTPRKVLDVNKARSMGWESKIELEEGIKSTYKWFVDNQQLYRGN